MGRPFLQLAALVIDDEGVLRLICLPRERQKKVVHAAGYVHVAQPLGTSLIMYSRTLTPPRDSYCKVQVENENS